jgi:hypothetical protein
MQFLPTSNNALSGFASPADVRQAAHETHGSGALQPTKCEPKKQNERDAAQPHAIA